VRWYPTADRGQPGQPAPRTGPPARGLINAATDVAAATNDAVAATTHLRTTEQAPRKGANHAGVSAEPSRTAEIPLRQPNR
jgi:hypothetical protein